MPKLIDLTGKKFGRWTVIEKAPSQKKETMWLCECSCSNHTKKIVSGRNLRNGKTQSCGCLHKELLSQEFTENLIGQKFGKLTVIERAGSQCNHATWLCECECELHTLVIVASNHLKSGNILSCGCIKTSYGEEKIQKILTENNIIFEREKIFENCKLPNSTKPLRFDFYVNNQYLIEYDGLQHFQVVEHWGGQEGFKKRQEADKFKDIWCKENNIPLIRIPYTKINTLCLNDLILF